jgi:hypothetical protein
MLARSGPCGFEKGELRMNILRNGDFEADWSEESSHHCLIFPVGNPPFEQDIGNIFTPPGWTTWFRHEDGNWSQPECRDARSSSPKRMHGGQKGFLLFTFSRKHDGGLMQTVQVTPGSRLRFSAWAHAWSNHKDPSQPIKFPHPDNPRWSEGAGFDSFFALEGSSDDDDIKNFTFWVGIDPRGGTDPFATTVVWGPGAHIYNGFHEVPAVEASAQSDSVTVFLRSRTLWPFKHNDAYWDDASLVRVGESSPGPIEGPQDTAERGKPREQYERVYVLLPPGSNKEWAKAVVDATWEERGYTVGGSADDAGIGDLDHRKVIAVNPQLWGPGADSSGLKGFFDTHYPGLEYVPITASTPAELAQALA